MLVYEYKLDGSKRLPSKRPFVPPNSFATSVCVCGWTERMSDQTTCRPIVLSFPKNTPSLLGSTPKPVKPAPIVPLLRSNGSMTIARTRNRGRRAIQNSSTTTGAWNTKRVAGSLTLMVAISPSQTVVGLVASV